MYKFAAERVVALRPAFVGRQFVTVLPEILTTTAVVWNMLTSLTVVLLTRGADVAEDAGTYNDKLNHRQTFQTLCNTKQVC